MGRTLRKLDLPTEVIARFVGAEKTFTDPLEMKDGNKYEAPLNRLAESPKFRFRARAENYLTPPKTITLVAAPAPASISIDKNEPAYIYHRLNGPDQAPLKGVRHQTRDYSLPTAGDTNTIEIPLGSDLTIHVQVDATTLDWGGLRLARLSPTAQAKTGLPKREGLLVASVDSRSVAERAGFKDGDVLSKLNQNAVPNDLDAFAKIASELTPSSASDFVVLRRGEKEYATTGIVGVNMPAAAQYQPRRLRPSALWISPSSKRWMLDLPPIKGCPPSSMRTAVAFPWRCRTSRASTTSPSNSSTRTIFAASAASRFSR